MYLQRQLQADQQRQGVHYTVSLLENMLHVPQRTESTRASTRRRVCTLSDWLLIIIYEYFFQFSVEAIREVRK